MTVTTFYATAGGDGRVDGRDGVFTTAQGKSPGDNSFDAETTILISTRRNDVPANIIERGFFPFDTSALPDADAISSAVFSLYATAVQNDVNDGDDWVNVVGPTTQNDFVSLEVADYATCGDAVDDPTEGSTRIDLGSISTSAYNNWTLNTAGKSWISKTAVTPLGVREGHDCLDNDPSYAINQQNRITVSASDETGTSQDPKLVVTHATAFSPNISMLLMGAG